MQDNANSDQTAAVTNPPISALNKLYRHILLTRRLTVGYIPHLVPEYLANKESDMDMLNAMMVDVEDELSVMTKEQILRQVARFQKAWNQKEYYEGMILKCKEWWEDHRDKYIKALNSLGEIQKVGKVRTEQERARISQSVMNRIYQEWKQHEHSLSAQEELDWWKREANFQLEAMNQYLSLESNARAAVWLIKASKLVLGEQLPETNTNSSTHAKSKHPSEIGLASFTDMLQNGFTKTDLAALLKHVGFINASGDTVKFSGYLTNDLLEALEVNEYLVIHNKELVQKALQRHLGLREVRLPNSGRKSIKAQAVNYLIKLKNERKMNG